MWSALKVIFCAFLIIVILAFAVPLLWWVIHLIIWLFGGAVDGFLGIENVGLVIFVLVCIGFIIWCLAS